MSRTLFSGLAAGLLAIAAAAQEFFPVPLVIVNRAGASGTIAAEYVRNAPPDGYTLLVAGGSESTSVGNHQKLPYDIRTDFTAIVQFNRQRTLLAVKGDAPYKTLKEFVTEVKANPGKYTYGSIIRRCSCSRKRPTST